MNRFLIQTFLFNGIDAKKAEIVMDRLTPVTKSFKSDDVIFPNGSEEKAIGFITKGKCNVERVRENGDTVLLNRLSIFDSFGILSMFSDRTFPTIVKAKGDTEIVFLGKTNCDILMEYPVIAKNMLTFVVNKAVFLNQKIANLSEKDVTAKLYELLQCEKVKTSSDKFRVRLSDVSRSLGCGRASVYRAIRALTENGKILYQNNEIRMLESKE